MAAAKQKTVMDKDAIIADLQIKLMDRDTEIENLKREIGALRERLDDAREDVKRNYDNGNAWKAKCEGHEGMIRTLRFQVEGLSQKLNFAEGYISALKGDPYCFATDPDFREVPA